MPEWDTIFREHGYFFVDPHPEVVRISDMFRKNGVKRILDLGCGTGRHIVFLSKCGFEMYGFDSSSNAVDLTNKWLEEENLTATVSNHLMQDRFLYPSTFFDAVISIQVIHHNMLKDIIFTIREMERVTRTGGYVFFSVPILGPKPNNSKDDWELQEVEPGTFIPRSGPESGIPHHFFTEDEIFSLFNGFNILEIFVGNTDHRCVLGIKK
ncbi:MAG: class I SAM-dependent methyltransferase [Candidatus Thorarchaeota archaeon]|nr:class I SAM-dependent methyltransferase [Candidatus Thorarchaeota archaeon]